jgi:hypothetical protein
MKLKNRKIILLILILLILLLLIILNFKQIFIFENFTNIRKPEDHEHEYIEPILRLLYSDEIKYINDSDKSDLIIAQGSLPTNKKPYIYMNGEPNLRDTKLYNDAVKDKYCVGCIVTSLNYEYNEKTFYLPMILDRGHTSFTKSPFIRNYMNNERPYLAAYIAQHSPQHRNDFFEALRKLDNTVDGLGKANHTKDVDIPPRSKWWELSNIYKDYKFGFAMENTLEDGYLTEKIMNVYLGGAIPLYWGSPIVKEIFNPDSFIYINDYPDFETCAKDVIAISKDPNRLKAMQTADIFLQNSKFQYYYDLPPPLWVKEIADKIRYNISNITN